MEYIKYFDEIIKRQSCRSFCDRDVNANELDQIKDYFTRCRRLIPEINIDFKIYNGVIEKKIGKNAGYNGFMIKAPKYALIFSEVKDHYLENAGYVGQAITLKMTQLGLDACWITINDAKAVKDTIAPDSPYELAAVIAFGYKDDNDKDVRLDIKSPSNVKMIKRKTATAPKISLDDLVCFKKFGNGFQESGVYPDLKDALLAISVSQSFLNRQPYRVVLDDDIISLVGFKDELTNENDEHLNYGIAMFSFLAVLAAHRTEDPKWSFEDPDRDLGLPDGYFFIAKCNI